MSMDRAGSAASRPKSTVKAEEFGGITGNFAINSRQSVRRGFAQLRQWLVPRITEGCVLPASSEWMAGRTVL